MPFSEHFKGQPMTEHTNTLRMIASSLALLRHSQAIGDHMPVRFSQARYFEAVLRTLPHKLRRGLLVNYNGAPIGIAGNDAAHGYDEWPTGVADRATDLDFYTEVDPPWRSPADFNAYWRKLETLIKCLEEGTNLSEVAEASVIKIDGLPWPTYRAYVGDALKKLDEEPSVYLALHGTPYKSAVAIAHQVAGKGKIATRRYNARTFEATRLCN